MNRKEICVECHKTLRNYSKGDKKIHRKCWMSLRDKSERHYDFLFCKDKARDMKKTLLIPPLDIAGNEVPIYSETSEPIQQISLVPPVLTRS